MGKELKPGDQVTWKTSQGKTEGTVEKKLTAPAKIKGHAAKASNDHPQFQVRSAKSRKPALHKPEALTKKD